MPPSAVKPARLQPGTETLEPREFWPAPAGYLFRNPHLCGPVDRSSLRSRVQNPEQAGGRPGARSSRRSAARRKLVIGVSGLAHEDSLAAGRIPRPGRAERPIDHDRVDATTWRERTVYPEIGIRIVDASPPLTVNQSGTNRMGAGRNWQPEASRVSHLELHAVERDIRRCATAPTTTTTTKPPPTVNSYSASIGNVCRMSMPATSTERKTLDVAILRKTTWRVIGNLSGNECPVADGTARYLHRCRNVSLNRERATFPGHRRCCRTRRWHRLEAGAHRVHIHRQQIADDVSVFGAIQPMQRGCSRVRGVRRLQYPDVSQPRTQTHQEQHGPACVRRSAASCRS